MSNEHEQNKSHFFLKSFKKHVINYLGIARVFEHLASTFFGYGLAGRTGVRIGVGIRRAHHALGGSGRAVDLVGPSTGLTGFGFRVGIRRAQSSILEFVEQSTDTERIRAEDEGTSGGDFVQHGC